MGIVEAIGSFPVGLRPGLDFAYKEGGQMADAMMSRGDMPEARALASGLALDPIGRLLLEEALDFYVQPGQDFPIEADEVIIGGGAHAATFAAVRNKKFGIKPLILERNARFGGTFAMTSRSSFFLNSRNRPGPLGAPGTRDALNIIPGAMMQPSDIGGYEYQANADLGLVIRMTLALNALVRQANVTSVAQNGPQWVISTDRGSITTKRVIVATGLGSPNEFTSAPFDGKRVLSYDQFMQRFDSEMFPLRGIGRVAVIGGGDSGKTAVEALTGYGPSTRGSVASLDYVPRIDWYGIEVDMTKERWLECNRTRYKPLAALFPKKGATLSSNARISGLGLAINVYSAFDSVFVNGRPYDTVVVCTGFNATRTWRNEIGFEADEQVRAKPFNRPDTEIALGRATEKRDVIVLGPATRLPFDDSDPEPRIAENQVALFRYAPRTATLASVLPVPF